MKDVIAMIVTAMVVVTAMAVEVNMMELVVVTEKEAVDLKYLICGRSGESWGGYIFDGGGWSRCVVVTMVVIVKEEVVVVDVEEMMLFV
ncbi:hypothetical protein F2Q69_00013674 [Brassica cretica]|uniref:Transmembrane protein n=1 Tax=Brassica cretica TaxID=69181 RepID=A0A8S9QM79_BRACR|nr:hypothetical protein F2Q69_00013674 [Brassica cretica]